MENRQNSASKPDIVQSDAKQGRVRDAPSNHWVYRFLPNSLWPYAQLARFDRPIGWKLLMWPCFWSLLLAANAKDSFTFTISFGLQLFWYLVLFFIGSVAMRGAGCTWNDLVDHKIDAMVERTRSRPLPSNQVTRMQAKIFMVLQIILGFLVLLQFNRFSIFLGMSSLLVVVLYPFMKRYTNWPQFFLGLAFSFGALMGWAALYAQLDIAPIMLYIAAIFWTIGYDTIYAHQDKEDDALVGVRSTARLFGDKTKLALFYLYSGFVVFAAFAFYLAGVPILAYSGLVAATIHMLVQIKVLDIHNDTQCLKLFKSNSTIGAFVFLGLVLALIVKAYYG